MSSRDGEGSGASINPPQIGREQPCNRLGPMAAGRFGTGASVFSFFFLVHEVAGKEDEGQGSLPLALYNLLVIVFLQLSSYVFFLFNKISVNVYFCCC